MPNSLRLLADSPEFTLSISKFPCLASFAMAGLLAGFPFTMYPLLVLMHFGYGPAMVTIMIKHYPVGPGSLMVYAAVVALSYAPLGIYRGTALGFVVATIYLPAFLRLKGWWLGGRGGG